MNGWIKIYRQMLQWEWYQDSQTLHLFITLLLSANREPGRWKGIEISRGQLITGRKQLSKMTGISEQSIRTCLNRLKSTNEITIKSTNKNSIITICKYEDYQQNEKGINQQNNQQPNQQLTSNQPQTRSKEVKKKEYIDDFDLFWKSYHSITGLPQTDKASALKYWNKLSKKDRSLALDNIQPYFRSVNDPKYTKKARTYLSDQNYQDEFRINGQTHEDLKPAYMNNQL